MGVLQFLPTGKTQKSSTPDRSSSGSVTYDYSHIDEKRNAHSKASQLEGDAATAAYNGDISGVINASNKIKALRDQANSIGDAPRIRSTSSSAKVGSRDNASSVQGKYVETPTPLSQKSTLPPSTTRNK